MFELTDRPPSTRRDWPHHDTVRAFLIESERRVLLHCEKLLKHDDLSANERRRLLRLAGEAQEELRRLAG